MNGFGSALFCATKRSMAALRSSTDRKTPRIRRRRVSLAKKTSTALSTEEADELLMAMALHVVSDDGAVEDVEGGGGFGTCG